LKTPLFLNIEVSSIDDILFAVKLDAIFKFPGIVPPLQGMIQFEIDLLLIVEFRGKTKVMVVYAFCKAVRKIVALELVHLHVEIGFGFAWDVEIGLFVVELDFERTEIVAQENVIYAILERCLEGLRQNKSTLRYSEDGR